MPTVTYDGRSFMLDGRRVWLVSGAIHYARVPAALWADRIHAAKLAGLNTIETPVFWNRHEPRPGRPDFKGDNDLRAFVGLIGKAGMFCILRPGPYVGANWDMGGLPPWVPPGKDGILRRASGPLLESYSRYLTAVVDQVRDLQATSPGAGPIILVQNESQWNCGDDKVAEGYLAEIDRYLHEAGINVPIINANNLWQETQGEIDCWSGSGDLLPTLRQLGTVRPSQPRLVSDFRIGAPSTWGSTEPKSPAPATIQNQLAQVLASGAQFNLSPFHGGTNFGFWGGRTADGPGAFVTASHDHQAPLSENGAPGPLYAYTRRLCMFASRFGRVLAGLEPSYQPAAALPRAEDSGPVPAVVHLSGTQGGIAFIFTDENARPEGGVTLLLPDGTTLPVPLTRGQTVAWCLLNASLGGRAQLDYCNLCTLAHVGRVFVCYGTAGTTARLSISGSPLEIPVPAGKDPTVHEHEGITVVICNEQQVDRVQVSDDAVYLGADTLLTDGTPVAAAKSITRIGADGVTSTVHPSQPAGVRGGRIPLGHWVGVTAADYMDGSSERFAVIDGPGSLAEEGSPYGLGWYRVRFKSASAGRARVLSPGSGDRLHMFLDGKEAGIMGVGPGAEPEATLALKRTGHTLVVLAENLGRVSTGADLGNTPGLVSHLWAVKPVAAGRAAIKVGLPLDVLSWRSPLWEVHEGDTTAPERLTWTLRHRRKTPLIVTIGAIPARALAILNDKPLAFLERGSQRQLVLGEEALGKGIATFQIAPLQEPAEGGDGGETGMAHLQKDIAAAVSFAEGVTNLSAKAEWGYARWEPPTEARFTRAARDGRTPARSAGPTWWRTTFDAGQVPQALYLDASGLTKGQVYVNGRHLCRYWVATGTGRAVPPQTLYFIPPSWLVPGENTILLFDEHGGDPAKCRLLAD
ncbi:MAG: beta-galactosidase [Phycisphaerales bacterium]|nr:beta-galactosidase [Phycisphaerales bacterium]